MRVETLGQTDRFAACLPHRELARSAQSTGVAGVPAAGRKKDKSSADYDNIASGAVTVSVLWSIVFLVMLGGSLLNSIWNLASNAIVFLAQN